VVYLSELTGLFLHGETDTFVRSESAVMRFSAGGKRQESSKNESDILLDD
jgi:hypothetical protein